MLVHFLNSFGCLNINLKIKKFAMTLKGFEKNIQSQFGEDGVIEEIFNRIGTKNKICVEFGAWDGIQFSNTWNLWYNKDWQALLIEGDSKKCETLIENTKAFNKVTPLNLFVSFEGENSLDIIFEKHILPKDIDCLSIDIDSDDYYVFESLKNFRPRLILVEYNPTIPPYLEVIQKKGEYFGCSALALLNLAKSKDYKLVHMTNTNMFFVSKEEFVKLNIQEIDINKIFPIENLTYVITAFDGRALLTQVPIFMNQLSEESIPIVKRNFFRNKTIVSDYKNIEIISKQNLLPVSITKKVK